MHAFTFSRLALLLFLSARVRSQDEDVQNVEEQSTVQICAICECSELETMDEEGPQLPPFRIVCNDITVKVSQFPELDKLQWPTYDYSQIGVKFEAIGLTSIERIPANHYVDNLSFEANSITTIWPAAFSELQNLVSLSLAHNNLAEITPDIFVNLVQLSELDLSFNKLSDFNKLQFDELKSLRKLVLRSNALSKVPVQPLSKIQNLEYLDLSENQIFYLDFTDPSIDEIILSKIKYLDLSHNKIAMLRKEMFDKADNLEYLDISNNHISNIDQEVFANCPSLIEINLSSNEITTLFDIPQKVQVLRISQNKLYKWPHLPVNVKLLDISFNSLVSADDLATLATDDLEVLNISGNQLTSFDILQMCPNLRFLDISYNSIASMPAAINSEMLPSLEELRIDGNPLKRLIFSRTLTLKRLFANQLNEITAVEEEDFVNVKAREDVPHTSERQESINGDQVQDLKMADCVDISISHCSKLGHIHEKAFQNVPLCQLDISYNNLTSLSKSTANWATMTHGVNLQGNPWDCECHLQWILDELLQDLYTSHPKLLHELRCETPRHLMGLRLVHWYNWGEGALCSNPNSKKSENYVLMESSEKPNTLDIMMGSSTVFVTILVCIIVSVICIIILVMYLVRRRGRGQHDQQLRQAMKRRRQTIEDRKKTNSEQFGALNKA